MNRLSMPRSRLSLAAIAVGLITAASAVAAAGGQAPSTTTLTFQGKQNARSAHFVDQAPLGKESPGDTISFSDTLYSAGKPVGFAEVTGTLLDNKRHDADNLSGTLILADGTIVLQGTSLGKAATQHLAVVGGTGAYAGDRGEAVVTSGPKLTTFLLELSS
jgi:hypothetical protein